MIGSIDTHDSIRVLANRAGAIAISVEYRLAPEHRYPAGVEDAVTSVHWAAEHGAAIGGDPTRLAVAGDSAGGNLAAVAALRVRNTVGKALVAQALLYPVTDHGDLSVHASRADHENTFPIRKPLMAWFHNHYFGHDDPMTEPDASPLHHPDLSGSAPAYVPTAGLDPLMSEGKAYAERWKRRASTSFTVAGRRQFTACRWGKPYRRRGTRCTRQRTTLISGLKADAQWPKDGFPARRPW